MAIDKNTNWNGRTGSEIEQYVKNTFESKVGAILKQGDEYLLFSDSITRAQYEEDNNLTNLIIDKIQIQSSYYAEIILEEDTKTSNIAPLGSTGHNISFIGYVKLNNGNNITDQIRCTYTIQRGNNKQVIRDTRTSGELVTFNVDNYLLEGDNIITIEIESITHKVKHVAEITYKIINIQVDLNYSISAVYMSTKPIIEAYFSVTGVSSITRYVHWLLDGDLLETDTINDSSEIINRKKIINLSESADLAPGVHSLQLQVSINTGIEELFSDIAYKEFIIHDSSIEADIKISQKIPASIGIIHSRELFGLIQYVPYELEFATYVPGLKSSYDTEVFLGNVSQGLVTSSNEKINKLVIVPFNSTDNNIQIKINTEEEPIIKNIPIVITPTTMDLKEITEDLEFEFDYIGKSNSSPDKDSWSYGNYEAVFEGFDWNNNSGWVNNSLRINNGASFSIPSYAPLAITDSGKTIEIEFSTLNVSNDDEIICDLTTNGIGLIIRATRVELISNLGNVLKYSFIEEESVRISFVIYPSSGDKYSQLTMLYINGILSGCVSKDSNENYISSKPLKFTGSVGAEIAINYIRIYNRALTDKQLINNYTLYRQSALEMGNIYLRNDIFYSNNIDTTKAAQRLPIMIVTGNIPTLENDKTGDEVIRVNIEYTNLQDTSLSFRIINGFMRIQGTSSLQYPRKNFRIYTKYKGEECTDLIVNGNSIENKLYSFSKGDDTKKPAQPVNCWCLKADFMESSSSHNTGIARLWNDALYNTSVQHTNEAGEYVTGNILRTEAQKVEGYNYDVRTTIDGFPILLFYKLTETSNLVFLGKYNFNNDKSTPSVFGFEGILGFNNTNVQCWEIRDSSNKLALFTDISNFDEDVYIDNKKTKGWRQAFESRYPDTDNPDTTALKNFSTWINNLYRIGYTEASEDFKVQKWEHFDIYKMAAYYVYLMRFGAVDQTVKNAMFTTEDGQHWFYINYDNDTVMGLDNVGNLIVPYNAMRDSVSSKGEYYYAGKDSVLWNFLERDSEFMNIVSVVDEALSSKLEYSEVVKMFNEKQTSKWAETIYNLDAEYKYLQPYINDGIDRLYVVQGNRNSHRSWWLAKRFALLDSKFITGKYKSNSIGLTFRQNTTIDVTKPQFRITAGESLYYGYGIINSTQQTGIYIESGESKDFTVSQAQLGTGSSTMIYGAMYIKELDLSGFVDAEPRKEDNNRYHVIYTLDLSKIYDDVLGTELEVLKIGSPDFPNISLGTAGGLNLQNAKKLKYLDLQNLKALTSIDVSQSLQLETLYTQNSGITNIVLPKGGILRELRLSDVIKFLECEDLPYLNLENINDGNYSYLNTVTNINIKNCPGLTNNFNWVKTWYEKQKETDNTQLILEGVNWSGVDINDLIALGNIKSNGILTLKGNVGVVFPSGIEDTEKEELATTLTSIYSDEINNGDLNISGISIAYIQGPDEVLEGGEYQYTAVSVGNGFTKITYNISGNDNSPGLITIDSKLGILKVKEGISRPEIYINAIIVGDEIQTVSKNITIVRRTYPTSVSINGDLVLNEVKEYTYTPIHNRVTGDITYNWSLTSNQEGALDLLELSGSNEAVFKINVKEPPLETYGYILKLSLSKAYNGSNIKETTINIKLINKDVIETDEGVITALRNTWGTDIFTSEKAITKQMVEDFYSINGSIFPIDPNTLIPRTIFKNNYSIKSFNGFQYFRETILPKEAFKECKYLSSIILPETLTEIGDYAFDRADALYEITIPKSVVSIKRRVFCSYNDNYSIKINITDLSKWCSIKFEFDWLYMSGNFLYLNGEPLTDLVIPSDVSKISPYAFTNLTFTNVVIPGHVEECGVFKNVTITNNFVLEYSPTSMSNPYDIASFMQVNGTCYIYRDVIDNVRLFDRCTINELNISIVLQNHSYRDFASDTSVNKLIINCDNWEDVHEYMCWNFINIDTIEIGESVTNINSNTFLNDINDSNPISKLIIGKNLKFIRNGAFTRLARINSANIEWNAIDCECETGQYPVFDLSKTTSFTFGNEVKTVPMGLCMNLPLSTITLPESLESIGYGAFYGSSLTEINIPDNVSNIGEVAFWNCGNLTSVKLPYKAGQTLAIGQGAFGTDGDIPIIISKVYYKYPDEIPNKINFESESANPMHAGADLYDGGNIRVVDLYLSNNITYKYSYAGCHSITTCTINQGSTSNEYSIKEGMFKNCTSLELFKSAIGTLVGVDSYAFMNTNLNSFTSFSNITTIGQQAFAGTDIENISLDSIVTLGKGAFLLSNLKGIYLGNSIGMLAEGCLACPYLYDLSIARSTAPAATGNPFMLESALIGSEITGNKYLRIPSGATGYDTGYWTDTLNETAGFETTTLN